MVGLLVGGVGVVFAKRKRVKHYCGIPPVIHPVSVEVESGSDFKEVEFQVNCDIGHVWRFHLNNGRAVDFARSILMKVGENERIGSR